MILFFLLLPLLARASFDADVARVNNMGDRADQLLKKFGATALPPLEKQNKESEHSLFQVHGSMQNQKIAAGSLAFGTLLNRLVVGGEASPCLVTIQNAKHGWLEGLRVMGQAHAGSTPGRVDLEFDRIILNSDKTVSIQAVALDESGALGLNADVFNGKALMIAGAMAGSFLSGYASGQQTSSTSPFGFQQTQSSNRNALLQGVAQTAADQSKHFIEDATAEKPILIVSPGTRVSIFFKEEL